MCIYCGTDKYRKIYENHYGPIPKDSEGRSQEIHHIDGNHKNNLPQNLKCVTIQEHYEIHFSQKDYGACFKMAKRMNMPHAEKAELARLHALKRVMNGTHPFLDSESQRKRAKERVEKGVCVFTDPNWQRENQKKIIKEGKHPSQISWTCQHCGTSGKGKGNYTRLHGNNCPSLTKIPRVKPAVFSKSYNCEHCGAVSNAGNHKQHHGSNCKKRK
jgi:transcription elongation factor Elf1